MKIQNQVRITNENVRITAENIQHIGECIALSAIKKMMRFAHHPRSLDKLYAGLVEDIYHSKGYNTTFSDGYDLASEVICFLCHYMAGLGFVEIAQMQNVNNTTVWRRRKSIPKKYLR